MNLFETVLAALYTMPLMEAALVSLLGNVAVFALALIAGDFLVRRFHDRANAAPPPPLSRQEVRLAAACVVLNTAVAIAGIALWRADLIRPGDSSGLVAVARDVLVLTLAMDLGMYVFHRVAHHPVLFRIIHVTHHLHERPRPLTLFVLNPFEVLGFGALLIVTLALVQASALAIVIYLVLNLVFGLVGHLGVEPAPKAWIRLPVFRHVSTSTFHAGHHQDKDHNFGFYTLIWDRLFGTLSPAYQHEFGRATGER